MKFLRRPSSSPSSAMVRPVGTLVQRYVKSRRGFTRVVTLFSVLGILLGVAALIIVLAVMSGFRQELMGRILGMTGHATVELTDFRTEDAVSLAAALKKVPGVVSVVPYVSGQVMVSAGGRATGAYVRGVADIADVPMLADKMRIGAPEAVAKPGQVLIGEGMANALGLPLGTPFTLLSPEGARTVMGFVPRMMDATVGGIFKIGMVQFDNALILMNLADAQMLLRKGNTVQALDIRVANPGAINALMPAIQAEVLKRVPNPVDVVFSTWETSNGDFFRALQVERLTMFIILSLIVLVAAFNIITGQMMLVNDKLADIAILRTMGATRGMVLKIFFYNGLFLGGLGTFAGAWIGMLVVFNMRELVGWLERVFGIRLFASDVYFLSELPSKLSWVDMTMVLVMAVVLTVLASLYPAWKASRMDPVELLRRG